MRGLESSCRRRGLCGVDHQHCNGKSRPGQRPGMPHTPSPLKRLAAFAAKHVSLDGVVMTVMSAGALTGLMFRS